MRSSRPWPAILLALWLLASGSAAALSGLQITLPGKTESVRFAVIGDSGRGSREQQEVADQLALAHRAFPFDFVIMLGDNIYEYEGPADYVTKFERPYSPLLAAGVSFYAAIGNHDPPNQQHYARFNMEGERYYTFRKGNVRFFVLDSTSLGSRQLSWLRTRLADSDSRWKIVYLHHPLYTSGRYRRGAWLMRLTLEHLLVSQKVNVVFSGHEHFYERFKPQGGITYFISGGAGSLRKGDIRPDSRMAAGFDQDFHFMLVEISGDQLFFQAIDRRGRSVDSGAISR